MSKQENFKPKSKPLSGTLFQASRGDRGEQKSPTQDTTLSELAKGIVNKINGLQNKIHNLEARLDLSQQRERDFELRAEAAEMRADNLAAQLVQERAVINKLQQTNESLRQENQRLRSNPQQRTEQAGIGESQRYYRILGIDPQSLVGLNEEQIAMVIDSAYRVRTKIFHPDNKGDQEIMKHVNAAYEYFTKSRNSRK